MALGGTMVSRKQVAPQFQSGAGPFVSGGGPGGAPPPPSGRGGVTMPDPPVPLPTVMVPLEPPEPLDEAPPAPLVAALVTSVRAPPPEDGEHPRHTIPRPMKPAARARTVDQCRPRKG